MRSDRIGHFTLNTELYLLEKKKRGIKSLDLFYLGRDPTCNKTLEKLWRKELIILPRLFLQPLDLQIRLFKFLKFLRCGNTVCDERDVLNLLDQYPATIKLSDNVFGLFEEERISSCPDDYEDLKEMRLETIQCRDSKPKSPWVFDEEYSALELTDEKDLEEDFADSGMSL